MCASALISIRLFYLTVHPPYHPSTSSAAIIESKRLKKEKKTAKDYRSEMHTLFQEGLTAINDRVLKRLPGRWMRLPYAPRVQVDSLVLPECKLMSSKMVPMWLVFTRSSSEAEAHETGADHAGGPRGARFRCLFKNGDDLRQDILTIQVMNMMRDLWAQNQLFVNLNTYQVLMTGVSAAGSLTGLIEVVEHALPTSQIQITHGSGGAMAALKDDPLLKFIKYHNKGEAAMRKAISNFTSSCAAYCCATYVLGIGDRHNSNIMVAENGLLFHIDYGHILGNFKTKFGIQREKTPFVFTTQMLYVITNGQGLKKIRQQQRSRKERGTFDSFELLCFRLFHLLRKFAGIWEVMFLPLVGAGLPELASKTDLLYLRDMLRLNDSPDQASLRFRKLLDDALTDPMRPLDNGIHLYKHHGLTGNKQKK
jgi:phosphatidylinositol-4,5-bisphosphate 3-kinase